MSRQSSAGDGSGRSSPTPVFARGVIPTSTLSRASRPGAGSPIPSYAPPLPTTDLRPVPPSASPSPTTPPSPSAAPSPPNPSPLAKSSNDLSLSRTKKPYRAAGVFQESPLSASRQSSTGEPAAAAPSGMPASPPRNQLPVVSASRPSSSAEEGAFSWSDFLASTANEPVVEDLRSSAKQMPISPDQLQRFRFESLRVQVDTLTLLDFSYHQSDKPDIGAAILTKITDAVKHIDSVINLTLAGNNLTDAQLLPILEVLKAKLTALESLDLSVNNLTDASLSKLSMYLSQCKTLQELHFQGNRFTARALQSLLSGLRAPIRSVDLTNATFGPNTATIIGMLRSFNALTRVDVAYTGLTEASFPVLVSELPTSMLSLNARGNRVVTLPDSISTLINLRHLDLSCNRLEQLSYALVNMTELETDFTGNPQLVQPPRETVLAGSSSIRTWLKANFFGEFHPRVRLVFLGNGSASKTALIRNIHHMCQQDKVRGAATPSDDSVMYSTSDPDSYPRAIDLDAKTRAHVINFPGDIETNRIYVPFLTVRNSIYVITVDTSQTSDKQLRRMAHYWLSMLQYQLGSRNCTVQVILVVTKADARPHVIQQLDALVQELRYEYPIRTLLIEERIYTTTSHPMDAGVQQLVKCIRKKASEILAVDANARVPDMFRQVEHSLATSSVPLPPVMDVATFKKKAIATIVDPRLAKYGDMMWTRCIQYLHETGSVLYSMKCNSICIQPDGLLRVVGALSRRSELGVVPVSVLVSAIRNQHVFSRTTEPELQQILDVLEQELGIIKFNAEEQAAFKYDGYFLPWQRQEAELCMLPGLFSTRMRYMGVQYVDDGQNEFALQEVFLSLQLILRQYYDLNYRLFTNVVLLKHKNSRAMVHYVAKSHAINVVVVGTPSPQEFLKALVEIFEIVVANRLRREQCPTKRLCPRCIQGAGIYSTVETSFGSCSAGHSLSLEDMKDGVLWEKRSWCRNSIWTSKIHETFYSSGDWRLGDRFKRTELTSADTDSARMKEYGRVRDMFYHFVREDSVRTFELDRIVFIDNLDLETSFQCFFERCIERFMSVHYAEAVQATALQNEDPLRKQWRRWVIDHFEAYQERRSGNNAVNMVPAWHGTSEEVMLKIAESNFLEPDELPPEKQTDPGYFGKGIYFTQYPSYGAQYVKENKCLLFSWVIMGRPYPVIESPTEANNLLGKGLMPGFDSHYVMVRQISPQVYHPCKTSETPDYDEMVLFSKNQILPRYIIYYRQREPDVVPVPIGAGTPVRQQYVIWVDDNLHGETKATIAVLRTQSQSVGYLHVTSTHELVVWLSTHEELLTGRERDAIRVVTCRYRERDGGPQAAEKLIDMLRGDAKTRHLKVMVYCGNPKEVAGLEDKKQYFVTSDPSLLKEFVTFKPFGDSGNRLLQPFRNLLGRKEEERNSGSGIGSNARTRPTRTVIWIDDKPNPSVSVIATHCTAQRIALTTLTSTSQLVDWASDQGNLFAAQNVRIVTNRFRQNDGGDNAASMLLQWLRNNERLAQSELLVFCRDMSKVAHLANTHGTAVTDDANIALRFALFEPLERLRQGPARPDAKAGAGST